MQITLFRAKLHNLRVTEANLYYEGSITLDQELMRASGILPYEKVLVVNNNNGARFETYTIPGPPGERTVCLNGSCARLAHPGDEVIVMAFAQMTPQEAATHKARVVLVDKANNPREIFDLAVADWPDALPETRASASVA